MCHFDVRATRSIQLLLIQNTDICEYKTKVFRCLNGLAQKSVNILHNYIRKGICEMTTMQRILIKLNKRAMRTDQAPAPSNFVTFFFFPFLISSQAAGFRCYIYAAFSAMHANWPHRFNAATVTYLRWMRYAGCSFALYFILVLFVFAVHVYNVDDELCRCLLDVWLYDLYIYRCMMHDARTNTHKHASSTLTCATLWVFCRVVNSVDTAIAANAHQRQQLIYMHTYTYKYATQL